MFKFISKQIGLDRTGHMSFPTGPDRIGHPNLPDRSCQTGLNPEIYFLIFYLTIMGYPFSYDKVHGHKFGLKKNLNWDVFENRQKKV